MLRHFAQKNFDTDITHVIYVGGMRRREFSSVMRYCNDQGFFLCPCTRVYMLEKHTVLSFCCVFF